MSGATEKKGGRGRSILVTGANGYLGRQLVAALAAEPSLAATLVAVDVRPADEPERLAGVVYHVGDVRDPKLADLAREHRVDTLVHLAAVVTPRPDTSAAEAYSIDVLGTRNVLDACLTAGVERVVYTSSGAAYGYHADNPASLGEDDPLRGNETFTYARDKRLVEELLARYRRKHPELGQVVLRPGTVLGESVSNQITAIFERPVVLGIAGSDAPFVFIWDRDLVGCLVEAVRSGKTGIFNVAGDGVVTLREVARRTGKPYLALPAWLVRAALAVLHPLGIAPYGPEQVDFIRYRPVLANDRLKRELGYEPRKSSSHAFDLYWQTRPGQSYEEIKGRNVVVTGAASGIGRAIACRFARCGARVALLDVDAAAAAGVEAELLDEGRDALAIACDVADADSCRRALERVTSELGGIDVLVANAGITHIGPLAETDLETYRRVLDVDFFGALYVTKLALESLLTRRGRIVVISSVAGFAPLYHRSGYAAAKHALHGLFETLRSEIDGTGTSVTMVCPGFTRTAIENHALGSERRRTTGRIASTSEVAEAVYRAALKRRRMIVLTPVGKISYLVSRVAPRLYERLMTRRMSRA